MAAAIDPFLARPFIATSLREQPRLPCRRHFTVHNDGMVPPLSSRIRVATRSVRVGGRLP